MHRLCLSIFELPRHALRHNHRWITNFCLSIQARNSARCVVAAGCFGVNLTVATTEPGIQVYDQRPHYKGLAIEAQGWPDAPNHADFPPITLTPAETYRQITEWRFAPR